MKRSTVHAWSDASVVGDRAAGGVLVWPTTGVPWYKALELDASDNSIAELLAFTDAISDAHVAAPAGVVVVAHTDCAAAAASVLRLVGQELPRNPVSDWRSAPQPRPIPNIVTPGAWRSFRRLGRLALPSLNRLCAMARGRLLSVVWSRPCPEIDLCDALARSLLGCRGRVNIDVFAERVAARTHPSTIGVSP